MICMCVSHTGINWNDFGVLSKTGINWNDMYVVKPYRDQLE